MSIATVISNLVTFLDGLSWTIGSKTTDFAEVFDYPNFNYGENPFCVVMDEMGMAETATNMDTQITTTINVYICANYGTADGQTDDDKMSDCYLRIRTAYDKLKQELIKNTTRNTIGVDYIFDGSYSDDVNSDFNIIRRRITLKVKELVSRL